MRLFRCRRLAARASARWGREQRSTQKLQPISVENGGGRRTAFWVFLSENYRRWGPECVQCVSDYKKTEL